MLALTFQIGEHRLALDVRQVTEVVPRVRLLPAAGGPAALAGTFVYRGQAVPVFDLHVVLGAGLCPPHLSSRIILAPDPRSGTLIGLLAAKVADVRELSVSNERAAGQAALDARLGTVLVDGTGLIHLVDLGRLLPDVNAARSNAPATERTA